MTRCHNCSLPEGTSPLAGRTIQVTAKPEFGDKRTRKVSVWVCSDDCTYQALAIAKYGPKTSSWPITLAKFRSVTKLDPMGSVANAAK